MLALLPMLLGFVTIPSKENASLVFRWTLPADSSDSSGLGGGLSYAMEPDFCPKMIDHFRDKEWISCDGIAHAIRRAFQSWAANHQMISFTNVSATCRADASVKECEQRNAVTCASLSGTARIECYRQRGNCTKLCGAAEVVLLAEASTGARLIDSVALVQHWDSLGATAADSVAVVSRGPRLTNGILSARDALIKKATVTYLRGPVCYYLDSTFCEAQHRTEREFGSVLVLYALFTMPFFALSLVLLIVRFCVALRVFVKHKRGWALAVRDAIKTLAEPLTEIRLVIFLVVLMPFLYFGIAEPCMNCYDFEASMAHEVGLVLGLAQPNVEGHLNFAATAALNASNCGADATLLPGQPHALAAAAPLPSEPSMMNQLLTREVVKCPTEDDLQGLNVLYPTCEYTRQSSPLCFESFENLGVLRLMSSVFLSVAISFTVAACLSRGSQLFETVVLRVRALRKEVQEARLQAAINIQARFRGHKARVQAADSTESRRNLLGPNAGIGTGTRGGAAAAQPSGLASLVAAATPEQRPALPKPKQVNRI